jgi:CBS domain containing-hemolysin-like protein
VLVHEGIGGLPLVSPRPELIARAVEIGRWLSQRGRAVDYTEEPVLIEAEEPLSAAGRRLQARGQRMAIVREDGAIYGLLSESDLLTWTLGVLAGERERDETVGEFVDLEQDPRIHFFPSTAELGEVVGALRTAAFEKRAAVCLIGGAGGARERIRGIATLADLPRLEALLSAD